jgi:xanthine/uracil permease
MVSKSDKSIVLGSVVFILVSVISTVGFGYDELVSFVVAGIVGVIVGLAVNKLDTGKPRGE